MTDEQKEYLLLFEHLELIRSCLMLEWNSSRSRFGKDHKRTKSIEMALDSIDGIIDETYRRNIDPGIGYKLVFRYPIEGKTLVWEKIQND